MEPRLTIEEAKKFCDEWLPAWSGNRPEALLAFYADDAVYRDPSRPRGLRGWSALEPYFRKLLEANPAWVWRSVKIMPTTGGFTLKWEARIPTPAGEVVEQGLDIVEIANGRITRNEVYFDRSALLAAMAK